ncbi:hypothetical protein E4T47_02443 [Aureobasidium subglaciale]|nr:hypothetical protein E4T47_02443 [Aureobasidium subglaciale]
MSANDPYRDLPPPPLPPRIPRTEDGRPSISLPVPGTFVDFCKSRKSSRNVVVGKDISSSDTKSSRKCSRKESEMPLSCHPPFKPSWIEIQPLTKHTIKTKPRFEPDVRHSSMNIPSLSEPHPSRMDFLVPQATSDAHGRSYRLHSILPMPENTQTKTGASSSERLNAPRQTPHYMEKAREPPRLSNPLANDSPRERKRYSEVGNPRRDYIPYPSALQQGWANRSSPQVILADSSLQLDSLAELNIELDEVMSLYTTPAKKF